ncbi:MAG TPA: hypothetical protein VFE14_11635, partial [Micromonosporaceae bacterium]|nr:hypothetical protein [Micromonosporaceae bacterium]
PGPAGYATGAQAPISVRVFNSGGTAVRLVGVASNAGEVVLFTDSHGSGGGVAAPTRSAVASRPASATPASSPAAPTATPTVSSSPSPKAATGPINLEIPAGGFVALDPNLTQYLMISALTKDVRPGEAIALTFRFSTGDQLTDVQVPMAVPVTPAPRSPMDLERTES